MSARPWPALTPDSEFFYRKAKHGVLVIEHCASCSRARHYPGGTCMYCGSLEREWREVSSYGTLYSFVVSHRSPFPYFTERAPFTIGLVEIDGVNGVRLLSNILGDREGLRVGARLQVNFESCSDEYAVPAYQLINS